MSDSIDLQSTAEGSDEANKSDIPTGSDFGQKKGIPAGRPGKEADMAQAALMLACNEYAYGQVSGHSTNVVLFLPFYLFHDKQTIAIDGGYLLEHP